MSRAWRERTIRDSINSTIVGKILVQRKIDGLAVKSHTVEEVVVIVVEGVEGVAGGAADSDCALHTVHSGASNYVSP